MSCKTCFIMGYQNASEDIRPALEAEIERHITEYGVRKFMVGNCGVLDHIAQDALIQAKQAHPDIFLVMVIPNRPDNPPAAGPKGFDDISLITGLETAPSMGVIPRLNRAMVRQSDYLILYSRYPAAVSGKGPQGAKRQKHAGALQISRLSG